MANTKQWLRRIRGLFGHRRPQTSSVADRRRRRRQGPSQRLIAWRRFLIESVLCLVLIGILVAVVVRASGGILLGPLVLGIATAIRQIVRC